jgi:acetyl esterase/lipase
MKYFTTLLFFIASPIAIAQTLYLDSIFSNVEKTTYNYNTHNNKTLQFDYYTAGDARDNRPLLVYVHGGGFANGARDRETTVNFATKLAQRGYAVASVSYRLTMKGIGFGCDVEAQNKIAAFDAASYDISSAIKHILNDTQTFPIDPNKIILAGSSAGAETVLHMAYVYQNDLLPSSFKYGGIISMAGAVISLDKINQNTAIPTQLFHGTGDKLVPYNIAPHHYCSPNNKGYLMLYGSKAIAKRLQGLGTSYYLYSIEGGAHRWAGLPLTRCFDEIIDFMYHDIVEVGPIRQTSRTINDL